MENPTYINETTASLYSNSEKEANLFNLKVLGVLVALAIISIVLNLLNVFSVQRKIMFLSMITTIILFFFPILLYLLHDKWGKKPSPFIKRDWFRKLIIVNVFIGIGFICITLSFHAMILLVIPPIVASQYHYNKRFFRIVIVATLLLVPISVYGSFFFGSSDMNLLKGLSREEAKIFANRLSIATPKRMVELFTHYILPMLFAITIVIVLVNGNMRRNDKMIEKQTALLQTIEKEAENRYKIQNIVIETLANMIETRDLNTGEHILRTKTLVRMIAKALQKDEKYRDTLTDRLIDHMETAAPLHDLGKIAISDAILLKPDKLTAEEFDKMKKHTTIGWQLIEKLFSGMTDQTFLNVAEDIALFHHEKWDGTGYPTGLSKEAIPLCARIMAVADVFDALISTRVYKKAIPPEEAFAILISESGTHFDPDILRVVQSIKDDLLSAVADAEEESY